MALEADSDRGSSRSAHEKYPRAALERNGYVKTCVTPLYQDAGSQSWLRLAVTWTCRRVSSAVCIASVSVILALLLRLVYWDADGSNRNSSRSDSRLHFAAGCAVELLLTACYCVSPVFTLVCAFFWVGLYLIRCGVLIRNAVFLLAVCNLGEAAAQSLLPGTEEQLLSLPATLVVLGCLGSGALLVVRLGQGVSILVFISVIRAVSLVSLSRVRASWRPYLAYLLGLLGVLLARYADRLLPASGTSGTGCCGSVTGAKEEDIPVFKRRRRSSSIAASEMMAHSQSNSKSHRRTSLPCIPRDQ
ncbi:cGMP-inhibited 3'%2C5'-cyclic phosphodiesterase 3A-like, partial [Scomber scombrus]